MRHAQQTSIEAWIDLNKSGTLGNKQSLVLSIIKQNEYGISNNEIAKVLGMAINSITPRVHELRAKGLVAEGRKRLCSVSGKSVIAWIVK